jgi:hypothetical protein
MILKNIMETKLMNKTQGAYFSHVQSSDELLRSF